MSFLWSLTLFGCFGSALWLWRWTAALTLPHHPDSPAMALRHLGGRLSCHLLRPGAPASLQLVSWLGNTAASPEDALEVAKALQANQFLETELQRMRAERAAISHAELLDYMQQRWAPSR